MLEKNVTGVAVVDVAGVLVGNVSIRDMKLIGHDARLFWRLNQPVKIFLAKLKAEWQSRHARPQEVATLTKEQTLQEVVENLVRHKIHRLFIVDGERKPIGVASLKDVLLEALTC